MPTCPVLLQIAELTRAVLISSKVRLFRLSDAIRVTPRSTGLVSVLIPTLAERHELLGTRCLPSIASQTYTNYEVIVVSEFYSQEVEATVNKFDERFRYLWGAEKSPELRGAGPLAIWCSGAAPSLNLALRNSRGSYLARLDDDDSWQPDHLENGVNVLISSRADFVSSNATDPIGGTVSLNYMTSDEFGCEYRWCRQRGPIGTPITWIFMSHVRALGFNENSWKKNWNKPVDYDFLLRSGAAGIRMVFSEKITAHYMSRPGLNGLTGFHAFLSEQQGETGGNDGPL